jgi:hypothetical protein
MYGCVFTVFLWLIFFSGCVCNCEFALSLLYIFVILLILSLDLDFNQSKIDRVSGCFERL